ncbi:MAG: methyltransferase [Burkholderiales bacterium PBB3]|nr:MAG: methyltransferase [Burkholderiales bacterium PBB3]
MTTSPTSGEARIHWQEAGQPCSAQWRSERGVSPPKRVVLADDTLSADVAYRLACEGTALLWRGDFQNARQMLQALARRADASGPSGKAAKGAKAIKRAKQLAGAPERNAINSGAAPALSTASVAEKASNPATAFHLHRQAQAQRARVLGMLLIGFEADYGIALKRAPDARQACAEAWGPPGADAVASVASLRELLGLISAHEWRKNGVEVPALGAAPHNRIHPHYGVFSPQRGEYVSLVQQAPLPSVQVVQGVQGAHGAQAAAKLTAFDIGVGTGVLSAVLARRGVGHIVATDLDPRALACAAENLQRLGVAGRADSPVQLLQTSLFPPGLAHLIVCNPPWLPARPSSPIEHAVYDEGSAMLLGFLAGLAAHLEPQGEGWLILSDLAEHLGLRSRAELLDAIAGAGLQVLGRLDTKPVHGKAFDAADPLHAARALEVTSLWRLAVAPAR